MALLQTYNNIVDPDLSRYTNSKLEVGSCHLYRTFFLHSHSEFEAR